MLRKEKIEWKSVPNGDGGFDLVKGAWHFLSDQFPIYMGGGFQPSDYDSPDAQTVEGSSQRVPRPKLFNSVLQDPCNLGLAFHPVVGECGQCCSKCKGGIPSGVSVTGELAG